MRINYVLFCEMVDEGQFGRMNLCGVLPQDYVSVSSIGYLLVSNIVISFSKEGSGIEKQITFFSPEEKEVFSQKVDRLSGGESYVVIPFNLRVDSVGIYKIKIKFSDGLEPFEKNIEIGLGSAPLTRNPQNRIDPEIILGPMDKHVAESLMLTILAKAREKLLVIDNYWETLLVVKLISSIHDDVELTILVHPNKTNDAKQILLKHPKTIIRSSSSVHDRYIILDEGEEVYQLGSSLNHLGGKITTLNKIVSKKACDDLAKKINSIFPNLMSAPKPNITIHDK